MRHHIAMDWLHKSSKLRADYASSIMQAKVAYEHSISHKFSFTGVKKRVNQMAGRSLGEGCLFTSQGDATSMGVGSGLYRSSPPHGATDRG